MRRFSFIIGLAFLLVGCKKDVYPKGDKLPEGVERVADYLYKTTAYDYDRAQAFTLLSQTESLSASAGSVVHNGLFCGVNKDGFFDTSVEFLVLVPSEVGRYGSMGFAGGVNELTSELVESGVNSEWYNVLPYLTTDGINENGVVCALCALSEQPKEPATPAGAINLTARMLPRYVLDNAFSAEHAVQLLADVRMHPASSGPAYQLLIADSLTTYVCQWIDGKLHTTNEHSIITNYPVLSNDIPAHSRGLERYSLAESHFSQTATNDGMTKLMHMLRATQMYSRKESPFRYSDYNGDWTEAGFANLTTTSPKDDYEPYIKAQIKNRQKNKRDASLGVWHTEHTALYDLCTLTLRLYVQEDYTHLFTLAPTQE